MGIQPTVTQATFTSHVHFFDRAKGAFHFPFGPCRHALAVCARGQMGPQLNSSIPQYLLEHVAPRNGPIVHNMWPFVLCGLISSTASRAWAEPRLVAT